MTSEKSLLKPHLACDIDMDTVQFPLVGMPKIDGVRGLHIKSDHNPVGAFSGRSLKAFKNKFVMACFNHAAFAGFDGEVTLGNITDSDLCRRTSGFVGRKTEKPGKPIVSPDLAWWVFDYFGENGEHADKPYIERLKLRDERLKELWPDGGTTPRKDIPVFRQLFPVPYKIIDDMESLLAFDAECIASGYEGSIYRDPMGVHKSGRCSSKITKKNKGNAYLRLKQFVDFEVEVVGLVEALENTNEKKTNELGRSERSSHQENMVPKGMVGMIQGRVLADVEYMGKVCMVKDQVIDIGPGEMDHAQRKALWDAFLVNSLDNIVGKIGTVKFFPHGQKDKPRFPTWKSLRDEEDMS